MRRLWLVTALAAALAPSLLAPNTAHAQARTLCVHGVAKPGTLPMRAGPGPEHAAVAAMPAEACGVALVGKCARNGWCDMALGGKRGWVDSKRIAVYENGQNATAAKAASRRPQRDAEEADGREAAACVRGVEQWDTLRIRLGPGVDYDAIGGIPAGACGITRAGRCRGSWCRVAWRGRSGWVNASYLRQNRTYR
ncbi:MAG: SH3 domain-containing protein [Hyphomicrobiaceae bacterium]